MNPPSKKGFRIVDRLASFKAAWFGFRFALRSEHNFQIHLFAAGMVVLSGIAFQLSRTEWAVISFAIVLVMATELMNTALEKLADALHPEKHPAVGLAKDLAAAAVLLSAVGACLVGGMVFWPYFRDFFRAAIGL